MFTNYYCYGHSKCINQYVLNELQHTLCSLFIQGLLEHRCIVVYSETPPTRPFFESNNCCLICLVNLYKCCISGLKQHLHGLIWELILFLIELKEKFAVKIDQTIRVVLIWRQDIILQIKHGLSCYMSSPYTISLRLVFCLQVWFNIAYLRTCVPRNSNMKKLNRSNRQQCIWVYK